MMPDSKTTNQIPILLTVVLLTYLGQMTLAPIVAPLAREVGLAEWQIGLTISVAALMVVLSSQFWGRRSQSLGRKPVLVTALSLATVATLGFALSADLGMRGILTGVWIFIAFIFFRGVGFGTAIAAVAPTAQAYIADVTEDEKARVKGMAGVGAVQGIAISAGAALGGLLAIFGLMTSLVTVPVLIAIAAVLAMIALRAQSRTQLTPNPPRVSPRDKRIWPFLVAGFGIFTALGFIQIVAGFLVQDRFALSAEATGTVTGVVLLAAGLGMVLAQGVIVPRTGWPPVTLLRVGAITGTVAFVALLANFGLVWFIGMVFFVGVGVGTAMPGYTAGASLGVNQEEQGGLAGLIGATNGLTFMIAPIASTALYGLAPILPIMVGMIIMSLVALFVLFHPRFRGMSVR